MANGLKFYDKEEQMFPEANKRKLTVQETKIVFSKLCRHFKLDLTLFFNGRINGGFYEKGVRAIELGKNLNFGILCHEIAHDLDHKKRGVTKHDKKLLRVIKRVINYCEKKGWWEDELKARTEEKPAVLITKKELVVNKIEKRKNDLIRYKKKLKYKLTQLEYGAWLYLNTLRNLFELWGALIF